MFEWKYGRRTKYYNLDVTFKMTLNLKIIIEQSTSFYFDKIKLPIKRSGRVYI